MAMIWTPRHITESRSEREYVAQRLDAAAAVRRQEQRAQAHERQQTARQVMELKVQLARRQHHDA